MIPFMHEHTAGAHERCPRCEMTPTATRIVATFSPDHTVAILEGGDAPDSFLVNTGRALVAFDNIADAIALALHNTGWGDYTIAADAS